MRAEPEPTLDPEIEALWQAISRLCGVTPLPEPPENRDDVSALFFWLAGVFDACFDEIMALRQELLRNTDVTQSNSA
jgi:hypothetical protein